MAYWKGRLTNGERANPKRRGAVIALEIPTRSPVTKRTFVVRLAKRNGGSERGKPLCSPEIPRAFVRLPGPAHKALVGTSPRLARIREMPAVGSMARMRTALPGSQTMLKHQCTP